MKLFNVYGLDIDGEDYNYLMTANNMKEAEIKAGDILEDEDVLSCHVTEIDEIEGYKVSLTKL